MKSAVLALVMVVAGVGFLVDLAVHLASLVGMSLFPRELQVQKQGSRSAFRR